MKTKSIFLLLLFICVQSAAQDKDNKYISFGLGPAGLIDYITPSLNIIGEIEIARRLNLETTYGLDIADAWATGHPVPESRHHEFKVCLKLMQTRDLDRRLNHYGGMEIFGVLNNYEKFNNSFTNLEDGRRFSFNTAQVTRNVSGIRCKLGTKLRYHALEWDFYIGGGFRFVNVEYESTNLTEIMTGFNEDTLWFFPIDERAGLRSTLDINVGFKLSYVINESSHNY